jgi:hypothetical protein
MTRKDNKEQTNTPTVPLEEAVPALLALFAEFKLHYLTMLPPLDANQRYSMREAERYLRCSHPELYKQIATGHLKTITDGRRRYVTGREIIRKSRESRA